MSIFIKYFLTEHAVPNYSLDLIFVEKYEVKHVLYIPNVLKEFAKYFFRYSIKNLKSKMSGDFGNIAYK